MKKMYLSLCYLQLFVFIIHAGDEMCIKSSNGSTCFYAKRSDMNHHELSIYLQQPYEKMLIGHTEFSEKILGMRFAKDESVLIAIGREHAYVVSVDSAEILAKLQDGMQWKPETIKHYYGSVQKLVHVIWSKKDGLSLGYQ